MAEENNEQPNPTTPEEALVSWVREKVEDWKRYRDDEYKERWDEYYRLWRGEWAAEDKTRDSERSRLISPALQQAVEMQVAELEEATFGREEWFDITDNYADRRTDYQSPEERNQIRQAIEQIQEAVNQGQIGQQEAQVLLQQVQQQAQTRQTSDVEHMKNIMKENFDLTDVKTNMGKIFLNGALYGTGIGKVVATEETEKVFNDEDPPSVEEKDVLRIYLEPVSPYNFVIDPASTVVEDAVGCAHEVNKNKHDVVAKQRDGVYRKVEVESQFSQDDNEPPSLEQIEISDPEVVRITEYWGLVPESLISIQETDEEESEKEHLEKALEISGIPDVDEDELVEAVVTYANDKTLLRAERNPFLMEDRPFVAYQHDTVPDTFWGRGVAEKGYNAQKALDGELRARMDGLALSVHPMMAYDATARPRGTSYTVHPGKSIGTTGPPKDALMPFNFGDINSKTFENAADLERMVQQATGSMDSAIPVEQNRRNETASGMSQIQAGAIKRSKRTLQNIEQKLVKKFLKKSAWRWQQFDSENFPMRDLKFIPHSSLGIMARELEQQQMIQLLSVVPQESEAFLILLKSIYENSSLSNREELVESINNLMQPDPIQQKLTQLELQSKEAEVREKETESAENRADAFKAAMEARKTMQDADTEQQELGVKLISEILDVVANQQQQEKQSQTALAQEVMRLMGQQQQAASNQGENG